MTDAAKGERVSLSCSPQEGFSVYQEYYDLAFGRRQADELYDLSNDPEQINNVAGLSKYSVILDEMRSRLQEYTAETGDPSALGLDAPWNYYPYYGVRKTTD